MTDICPACGYYLYDGECQGCGSMFTEEALNSIAKTSSSLEKIYDGVREDGLRHVLWGDHSTPGYRVIHWVQSPDNTNDKGYTHTHSSEDQVKECLMSGWSINKEAADIDQFPTAQDHSALVNSGWYQHSKEVGDPYPVYYKNGPKYLHILQYKPKGENNWHLEHVYPGGMLARREGPPLPEPTSHSRLVGNMGENTVGERMKSINVDRAPNPIYEPYIPEVSHELFQRQNSLNPGVFRFSDSTRTEDLINDGPMQQPQWFAPPIYHTERVDPTEDTSGSVERFRDADVSVENGAPRRTSSLQVGDHVHAHCPKGHSRATRINVGTYRCDECGTQWRSKNSSWKKVGQGKGNQGDGLNFDSLRPGNWQRKHGPDSEDRGLENGWRDEEEETVKTLEPKASWKKVSEIPDDEIHRWMGDLTPEGHQIPNWGSTDDEEDDYGPQHPSELGLDWVSPQDHDLLTSKGFRLGWDGDYTKAFNTDYRGHVHDHSLTPHEQGDWEHYVRFNHPDKEDSQDYVGNSAHLGDLLDNVSKFEQEGNSRSPALFDRNREREFLSTLNSGPMGDYKRV